MGIRLTNTTSSNTTNSGFTIKFTECLVYDLNELVQQSTSNNLKIRVKYEKSIAQTVINKLKQDIENEIHTSVDIPSIKNQIAEIIASSPNDEISTFKINNLLKSYAERYGLEFTVYTIGQNAVEITYDFAGDESLNKVFNSYYSKYAAEFNIQLKESKEGELSISDIKDLVAMDSSDYAKYLLDKDLTGNMSIGELSDILDRLNDLESKTDTFFDQYITGAGSELDNLKIKVEQNTETINLNKTDLLSKINELKNLINSEIADREEFGSEIQEVISTNLSDSKSYTDTRIAELIDNKQDIINEDNKISKEFIEGLDTIYKAGSNITFVESEDGSIEIRATYNSQKKYFNSLGDIDNPEEGIDYIITSTDEEGNTSSKTYVFVNENNELVPKLIDSSSIDLEGYVTEEWVENKNYLTNSDLETYATTEDLTRVNTNISDINRNIETINGLVNDLANNKVDRETFNEIYTSIDSKVDADDLNDYVKNSDLDDTLNNKYLSLKEDIVDNIDDSDLYKGSEGEIYASKVAITGDYNDLKNNPTKLSSFDNDTNYLTNSDLETYAKKADLPKRLGQFINDVGYLKEHQSLDDYALKSDLPTRVGQLTNDKGYYIFNGTIPEDDLDINVRNALADARRAVQEDVLNTKLKGYLLKEEKIDDIDTIRANAALGATALQSIPSDYAKKSDIPLNVSHFDNDAGYLVQGDVSGKLNRTEFEEFVTSHGNEFTTLNNKVNTFLGSNTETLSGLKILIEKAEESEEISTFTKSLGEIRGELNNYAVKGHTHPNYITQGMLSNYAQKEHTHENYITNADLIEQYAPKDHIHEQYASKVTLDEYFEQLKGHNHDTRYLTINDGNKYALKSHGHDEYAIATSVDERFEILPAMYAFKDHVHIDYVKYVDAKTLYASKVHNHDDLYARKDYIDQTYSIKNHVHANYVTYSDLSANYSQKYHTHDGYLTRSDLSEYALKIHTHDEYATKNEIANTYSAKDHTHANYLTQVDLEDYALKDHSHSNYLTQEKLDLQLEDYVTREDIPNVNGLLKISEFNSYKNTHETEFNELNSKVNTFLGADETTLAGLKTLIEAAEESDEISSLTNVLTTKEDKIEDLDEIRRGASLGASALQRVPNTYALKSEIPTIPVNVSEFVNDAKYLTSHQSLAGYALKTDIPNVPTKLSAFENDKGYLTQHQSLSGYAKKSDIPTVPTRVSELENDEGYLKEHQSLASYAKKIDLPTRVGQLTNDAGYLTEHQSLANYALKSEIPNVSKFITSDYHDTTKQDLITEDNKLDWNLVDHPAEGFGGVSSWNDLQDKPTNLVYTNMISNFITDDDLDNKILTTLDTRYQPAGNYLTQHQDISGKLDASEFNSFKESHEGEYNTLNNKVNTFLGSNTETLSGIKDLITAAEESGEISALTTALGNKQDTISDIDVIRSNSDLGANAYNSLGNYALANHTHDNYISQTELDNYALANHTHANYVTQSTLEGYSEVGHTHSQYLVQNDLANYATKNDLENTSAVSGTKDTNGYLTSLTINEEVYLVPAKTSSDGVVSGITKSEADLLYAEINHTHDDYATKDEIPDLDAIRSKLDNAIEKSELDEYLKLTGGTLTGNLTVTRNTWANNPLVQIINGHLVMGDTTSTSYHTIASTRSCNNKVNSAAFYVNSDGTAMFAHKGGAVGVSGVQNDAYMIFNQDGFKVAYSGTYNKAASIAYDVVDTSYNASISEAMEYIFEKSSRITDNPEISYPVDYE